MVYRGTVKSGVIVIEDGANLREGAKVEVRPLPNRTLLERLNGAIGIAEGLPADMAKNHDHYIHGVPKRQEGS